MAQKEHLNQTWGGGAGFGGNTGRLNRYREEGGLTAETKYLIDKERYALAWSETAGEESLGS